MTDTIVNSVQPSEVSPEMVAYLLTTSILGGSDYAQGWSASAGLPLIHGCSKEEILSTYTECLRAVRRQRTDAEHDEIASRRR
jgi:hypothetical protein